MRADHHRIRARAAQQRLSVIEQQFGLRTVGGNKRMLRPRDKLVGVFARIGAPARVRAAKHVGETEVRPRRSVQIMQAGGKGREQPATPAHIRAERLDLRLAQTTHIRHNNNPVAREAFRRELIIRNEIVGNVAFEQG